MGWIFQVWTLLSFFMFFVKFQLFDKRALLQVNSFMDITLIVDNEMQQDFLHLNVASVFQLKIIVILDSCHCNLSCFESEFPMN